MGRLERNFRNVIQLAVAFCFINFGIYCHQYIFKETIMTMWDSDNLELRDKASDVANTLFYIAFGVSSVLSPAIIGLLGAKTALLTGTALIFSHVFTMIVFKPWLCFLTSTCQGLGSGFLWGAQGKLLKLNCTPRTADKYTNTFFGICYSSTIFSSIFLLSIFIITNRTDGYSIDTLITAYLIMSLSIVGGFITIFFLKTPSKNEMTSISITVEHGTLATNTYVEIMFNVFRVLFKKEFFKYAVLFTHFGISCSIWSSIIPSTISASIEFGNHRFYHMACCCFVQGTSQLIGAFFFFFYGHKFRKLTRLRKAYLGCIFTFLAYVFILLTIPPKSNQGRTNGKAHIQITSPIFPYIPSILIGLGDIIFKIQTTTHVMDVYPEQSGEVFSLFNGFQGIGMALIFILNIYITLDIIMSITSIYLLFALFCFYIADRNSFNYTTLT
uniref:UNC93-like protein MFSD11 (inferred by orthology to a human protein) n=1 Tax=Strongyloides venezuelensis TaxID=75913 RepID=A0A0K0F7M1_STRVS